MNQILVTKLKKHKKAIWYKIQFGFSFSFVLILLIFLGVSLFSLINKETQSSQLLNNYNVYQLYAKNVSNEEKKEPNDLFGIIEIPKINIYYPIFSHLTEELLKISPCKFYGESVTKNDNICIAGHNYNNTLFFSKINTLTNNDDIYLYDNTGQKFTYTVFTIYEVKDNDLSPIFNYDKNGKELTLITCNNLNNNRIIVKAKQKSF